MQILVGGFDLLLHLAHPRDRVLLRLRILELADVLSRFVLLGTELLELALCRDALGLKAQDCVDVHTHAFELRAAAVLLRIFTQVLEVNHALPVVTNANASSTVTRSHFVIPTRLAEEGSRTRNTFH